MPIYNKIRVLLSTVPYMFRRLLHQLQGEFYHALETIITWIAYRSSVILYAGLKLYLFSYL